VNFDVEFVMWPDYVTPKPLRL